MTTNKTKEMIKLTQVKEIKALIEKLERDLFEAKVLLKKTCPHKYMIYDNYARGRTIDYRFICKDCGMILVTDDPNFGE